MADHLRNDTREEVERLLRSGARGGDGYLDLTHVDLTGANLRGLHFRRVRFSDEFAGRRVIRWADFTRATFDDVQFPMARFEDVKLQESQIINSDLRYAEFVSTSFARARLESLDMYRTAFIRGDIFEGAELRNLSLHLADLSGSDVRWSNFRTDDALMAATPARLLELLHAHPDRQRGLSQQIDRALLDAASVYRHLTGLWQAKGQYGDSAQAYVRLKQLERKDAWSRLTGRAVDKSLPKPAPIPRSERFDALRAVLGHAIAQRLCLYGERLDYIAGWLIAVVFVTAAAMRGCGGLVDSKRRQADFWRTATYALKNIIGLGTANLHPASGGWEFVAGIETLAAVVLLGLFGFVLGNNCATRKGFVRAQPRRV